MSDNTQLARQEHNFASLIKANFKQISSVIPKHLTPERLARLLVGEGRRNPKLFECEPESVVNAIMVSSQLGLEPGGALGHIYLIPYKRECTVIIGYKGLLELARRSGQVKRINAQVVYRDEYEKGLVKISVEPPTIEHAFSLDDIDRDPKNIIAAYAVVEFKDGSKVQGVLTRADILKRKAKGGNRRFSPWDSDFAAMARKSAIRALLNGGLVPLSSEIMNGISNIEDKDLNVVDVVAKTKEPSEVPLPEKPLKALGLGEDEPAGEKGTDEPEGAGGGGGSGF